MKAFKNMNNNSTYIEFQKSEYIIEQGKRIMLYEKSDVIISSYFLSPIRFFINNVDILESNGDPWMPVPLLDFIIFSYNQFLGIYKNPYTECRLGATDDKLIFEKDGDRIKIISTRNSQFAWIDSHELFYVFTKFVKEAREYLAIKVPNLFLKINFLIGWDSGIKPIDYLIEVLEKDQKF